MEFQLAYQNFIFLFTCAEFEVAVLSSSSRARCHCVCSPAQRVHFRSPFHTQLTNTKHLAPSVLEIKKERLEARMEKGRDLYGASSVCQALLGIITFN